jgi:cysteine desulfurase
MRVYLDNAATTPVAPEVVASMIPVLSNDFGNPSSTHFYGRQGKALLETSRRKIATYLNCSPSELIFTSGGTEADNMALTCAVETLGVRRIITTTLEHHAVGHTVGYLLEKHGVELVQLQTDKLGHINLHELRSLLETSTIKTLVSLMHANNEIGTRIDLAAVNAICKEFNALFHSDTVQTMGHYAFDLNNLQIDFLTCAGHKFHGPKGIGFLYLNKTNKLSPFIHGGAQERGLRGGTENIHGIVGLAKAFELAYEHLEEHQQHVQGLKTYMMESLKQAIPTVAFNGDVSPERSLYTVLNVSFPQTEKAGTLLFTLDLNGVAASGGSACSSGAAKGSHVLEGIGADPSRPTVRFSFSRYTTREEIDFALQQIIAIFNS